MKARIVKLVKKNLLSCYYHFSEAENYHSGNKLKFRNVSERERVAVPILVKLVWKLLPINKNKKKC